MSAVMGSNSSLAATRDRVRVVTLIDYLGHHGGAESLALSVVTRLDPERFDATYAVSRWPPPEDVSSVGAALQELSDAGVEMLGLGRSGRFDVWIWAKLFRHLRRERIDVLHAHKFGSNIWAVVIGRLAGTPVIVAHEHSWTYEGQPLRRFLDRWLIGTGASRFVAVSQADRRLMTEVEKIPPRKTVFIPNGVPTPPPPSGAVDRAQLGLADDDLVVVAVGTLRPVKRYDVLVRAAALLAPAVPKLRVLLVGDGDEVERLRELARELGAADVVRFAGHRTDVADVLAVCDAAVCCSDREGSPLSVMEYMEAGLPVVGTAVGGVPDLIEPGVNGLLVPRRDPQALADALAELLGDLPRARAWGAAARARRRAEFDIDVLVRRIEQLYDDLLDERRPARARRQTAAAGRG